MKKYLVFYMALSMTVLCFVLTQCKKKQSGVTITLHDQSLPIIRKYVSGNWKLEYTYGGIIANLRTDFHNEDYVWTIDSGLSIKQTFLGNLVTDTSIQWYQISIGADKTFIMKFYDKRMYPYNYIVWGIVNESLVLRDYGSDPVTYHFSKQN